jgi:hypothetical protein
MQLQTGKGAAQSSQQGIILMHQGLISTMERAGNKGRKKEHNCLLS